LTAKVIKRGFPRDRISRHYNPSNYKDFHTTFIGMQAPSDVRFYKTIDNLQTLQNNSLPDKKRIEVDEMVADIW